MKIIEKIFTLFLLLMAIIAGIMIRVMFSTNEKYPSNKYKKVIKEGFFFDYTEYHER